MCKCAAVTFFFCLSSVKLGETWLASCAAPVVLSNILRNHRRGCQTPSGTARRGCVWRGVVVAEVAARCDVRLSKNVEHRSHCSSGKLLVKALLAHGAESRGVLLGEKHFIARRTARPGHTGRNTFRHEVGRAVRHSGRRGRRGPRKQPIGEAEPRDLLLVEETKGRQLREDAEPQDVLLGGGAAGSTVCSARLLNRAARSRAFAARSTA